MQHRCKEAPTWQYDQGGSCCNCCARCLVLPHKSNALCAAAQMSAISVRVQHQKSAELQHRTFQLIKRRLFRGAVVRHGCVHKAL